MLRAAVSVLFWASIIELIMAAWALGTDPGRPILAVDLLTSVVVLVAAVVVWLLTRRHPAVATPPRRPY